MTQLSSYCRLHTQERLEFRRVSIFQKSKLLNDPILGNVQSLMLGANFFQLQEVVQHCGQFLITRLDSSNALSIREFCKLMSVDEKIVQLATSFVLVSHGSLIFLVKNECSRSTFT